MRKLYVAAGLGLIALGVVISPLPGPGGLPVALVGTVVVLKHSPTMRRRWVKARRRWPQVLGPMDSMMRRLRRKKSAPSPSEK